MDAARLELVQSLFHRSLNCPEAERSAFLASACGADAQLHAEVSAMLAADAKPSLLERGVSSIASQLLSASALASDVGPYRLVRVLGEGGMGVVWLAERTDAGNLVAIKFLPHAGLSPARRDRFTKEIKTLAKLKHPYIARLYDAGTRDDGTPWFVMEYVDGLRLDDWCRRPGATVAERLRLFRCACEAVEHAHRQSIVHCDLKPSNILVESDGTPRLLDFGVARELQNDDAGGGETRPGPRFLSPDYAAPEWISDSTAGLFTDVYSLGVILFEMLTGRRPERGAVPPKLSAAAPRAELSGSEWSDLDVLCSRAMHPDVQLRYPTAEALLRDVNHFLNAEPLEARPGRWSYRLGKFVRRHRGAVAATAAAFALILGLSVFFTVRLAQARDRALAEAARTRRIQRVMLDLLGDADKSAAPAQALTVVSLLDRGRQEAAALKADPDTQAELYSTLGRMYSQLHSFQKADELFRLALAAIGNQNPPRASGILSEMSGMRAEQADYKEAGRLAHEAVTLAGQSEPAATRAKAALGRALAQGGSYEKAVPVLEPLVASPAVGEEEQAAYADSLNALAVAHHYLGHYQTAESLYRRLLAFDRQVHGESHPENAEHMANLATTELSLGRYAEAEKLYRDAARIYAAWYGPENPVALQIASYVSIVLIRQGKDREAETQLENLLAVQQKTFGPVHPNVAITLDSLGRIAERRGDLPKAVDLFTRSMNMLAGQMGPAQYNTCLIRFHLGRALLTAGDPRRAEALLREALAGLTATPRPGDVNVAEVELLLGRTLLRGGRLKEAEPHLNAANETFQARPEEFGKYLEEVRHGLAQIHRAPAHN